MNKRLFVVFFTLFSSSLCASSGQLYFEYPGQTGPACPLSPQKSKITSFADFFDFSQVTSQMSAGSSSQSSSNSSTPEQIRKADIEFEKEMAALILLQKEASKR